MSAAQPPAEPFDPALSGTPEHVWDEFLRPASIWTPGPRPLLVVSPHPDDEVLAAGGLMRLHAHAGFDVTVLGVTDGEAAYPDWVGLDRIRRREQTRALRILGAGKIRLHHLGFPDGRVNAFRTTLFEAISRYAARRPIIVAPFEADGHPDHDATGEVCADIARLYRLTLIRYPLWTWHHARPETLARTHRVRVPLDPATGHTKALAIECFASQLRPPGRPPIVPRHVLCYFKRAYEAFLP